VLQLVPGFAAETDVEGSSSFVFRGINATEGRVLILLDGHNFLDLMYSFPNTGDRFPIDQIERIEIIRGPGSAIYGGNAELGVINIVTRGADSINTVAASMTLGQFQNGYARQTISLAFAQKFPKQNADMSVALYLGRTHRSGHDYTDFYDADGDGLGDSVYPLTDGGQELPAQLNVKGRYKDLKLGFLFDNYRESVRDNYDASTPTPYEIGYRSLYASAEYGLKVSKQLTLTPRLSLKWNRPWYVDNKTITDASDANPFYEKTGTRVTANTTASWDILDCTVEGACSENLTKFARELNLLAGAELYVDRGKSLTLEPIGFQSPLECDNPDPLMCPDSTLHSTVAVFAQALDKNFMGTFTLGARYEVNDKYGNSFVPRAAYTRVFGKAHVKALASRAFRAPSYENISLEFAGTPIQPERTTVYELEAGYKVTPNAIITANIFDQTIRNPIVYYYDVVTNEEGYQNQDRTGSRGAELEARVRFPKWWVTANYSWYSTSRCTQNGTKFLGIFDCSDNTVDTYALPGNRNEVAGMPKHKIAALGSIEIIKNLRVNPQVIWMSAKHYYYTYDLTAKGEAELLTSLFVSYKNPGNVKGLDVSAGVHNILDTEWYLVQPYDGYHPRVPGQSREFMLRVSWEM